MAKTISEYYSKVLNVDGDIVLKRYKPYIKKLVGYMRIRLEETISKRSFLKTFDLHKRFEKEVSNFKNSMGEREKPENVWRDAADVANLCFMLAGRYEIEYKTKGIKGVTYPINQFSPTHGNRKTGELYEVMFRTNENCEKENFPETVIYRNEDKKLYSLKVADFDLKFSPVIRYS